VKNEFITANKSLFPVEKMCQFLEISTSSYYSSINRIPSKRYLENQHLVSEIIQAYYYSKCTYGSPRIALELSNRGISVSQRRVASLMKKEGIKSIIRKQFRVTTTDSTHHYPVVSNFLDRKFNVEEKATAWVSDITYVKTKTGWLYLTIILDLADRKVIGWALSDTLKAIDTCIPAWNMAIKNRPFKSGLILHSDRGVQYACREFVKCLKNSGIVRRSMSRKGNCWDNAVAESFFKTLKVEMVYQTKFETNQEAELAIFEYIETWYNRNRRHSALGGLTIHEFNNNMNIKKAA
jgi:putative transposase